MKKKTTIKAYIMHHLEQTFYVLCNDREFEISLWKGKEIKRKVVTSKVKQSLMDKNFKLLTRTKFLNKMEKAKFELSEDLQKLLNTSLQIKMTFNYKLL